MNGLRSVIRDGHLERFIEEADPDVLCINETKVDYESLTKEGIKDYMARWFPTKLQFWNCCKFKKGYAGVVILVKSDFAGGAPLKVKYDFGEKGKHDQEGRTVTCVFREFFLVATYVPVSGIPDLKRLPYRVDEWDPDFHKYLKDELEIGFGKPVILCGDLNVAHNPIDIFDKKKQRDAGFTPQER